MALKILLDDFEGVVTDFYNDVAAEIDKREVPRMETALMAESRPGRWFVSGEKARCLLITDGANNPSAHSCAMVFALQYGTSFFVSTRHDWQHEDKRDHTFLEEARCSCFMEVVDRAVKAALEEHVTSRGGVLPSSLRNVPNAPR